MTVTSIGTSNTDRPARYAKQLISHMSRRASGEWDTESKTGWIEFTRGRATFACFEETPPGTIRAGEDPQEAGNSPCKLVISLVAEDEEAASLLEGVLERHLVKFGLKDNLTLDWVRS